MTIEQIRQFARDKGWPGIRIDANEVVETDKIIIRRMPMRDVDRSYESD